MLLNTALREQKNTKCAGCGRWHSNEYKHKDSTLPENSKNFHAIQTDVFFLRERISKTFPTQNYIYCHRRILNVTGKLLAELVA